MTRARCRTHARLWFQGSAQPESCSPLFDALVNRAQLTQEDVWIRVRLTLEAGNVSFAKLLMAYLPAAQRINPRDLDAAARVASAHSRAPACPTEDPCGA